MDTATGRLSIPGTYVPWSRALWSRSRMKSFILSTMSRLSASADQAGEAPAQDMVLATCRKCLSASWMPAAISFPRVTSPRRNLDRLCRSRSQHCSARAWALMRKRGSIWAVRRRERIRRRSPKAPVASNSIASASYCERASSRASEHWAPNSSRPALARSPEESMVAKSFSTAAMAEPQAASAAASATGTTGTAEASGRATPAEATSTMSRREDGSILGRVDSRRPTSAFLAAPVPPCGTVATVTLTISSRAGGGTPRGFTASSQSVWIRP
mmetsp:Transcript_32881/g.95141  ORF Transcript_32881/g.95141 Transcript_32881/m.95141 type:complete len:272 (-) Transcript_32881:472-1287(-)